MPPGTYEFFRRLVFSVLVGNDDMHLKNWSLLYPDRRSPVLSPGYDFVATLPYIPSDNLALTFGGSRSPREITTAQVRLFADTARLPASPLWRLVTDVTDHSVAACGRSWRERLAAGEHAQGDRKSDHDRRQEPGDGLSV